MPTYQYLCGGCGHEFDQFQSISAKPLRKCPACGKLQLNRLIGTGSGIIFKGSGFYQTDYRSENYKNSEKKAKPAAESKNSEKKDAKSTPSEPQKAKNSNSPAQKEPS